MEQEKLYSPLNFYLRDSYDAAEGLYDEGDYWRDTLSHADAFGYLANIKAALFDDRKHWDTGRGLAEYLPDSLDDVIVSLYPGIELHGDKLWLAAEMTVSRPITPGEMGELTQWWEGQLSDGWGEGFEQHEIKVDRGDLYMEPWSSGREFFIDTESEFSRRMGIEQPIPEENLPELHPDDLIDNMESELFPRLDRNLSDYCESLLVEDKRGLIGMAEEIAIHYAVRDYLKQDHKFNVPELEFLLQFRSPLTVVCEHTPPISKLLEMSGAISELANLEGALRRDYQQVESRTALLDSLGDQDAQLAQIAKKHLRVETLETRRSDSLDFHEVSVWGLKAALEEAFKAGLTHQLAQEKPQAALDNAPAEPQGPSREDILLSRLETNLADMMNDLRTDISDTYLPTHEFVALADRVTAVSSAYEYLTDHALPDNQVEYLLNFQCPLQVVADRWSTALDMDGVMWDICDKQDGLQGDYSLMANTAAEPEAPPQEQPATGKPSLLAGLREAKAKTPPPKEKNDRHTGPEL